MRIPLSTYRLQFGRGFGFREARELVPYLERLGISDIYASPIFQAHSDTSSGYDVVDPTRLSRALGTWDDFIAFCTELKRRDMGLILDIVPNHMSDAASNLWWRDVLENGPSSPYENYFDIEWDPPSHSHGEKMLWPILGAPYADVLERQRVDVDILGGRLCDPVLRADTTYRSGHLRPDPFSRAGGRGTGGTDRLHAAERHHQPRGGQLSPQPNPETEGPPVEPLHYGRYLPIAPG